MQQPALGALTGYETRIFACAPPAVRFTRNDNWLVAEAHIRRLPLYPFGLARPQIPGLFRTNVYGLLKSRLVGNRLVIPSGADAIQLKANGARLRAFYFGGRGLRQTIKIVDRRSPLAARAEREIDVRRRLEALNTITIPGIERVDYDDSHVFVVEQLVVGRRFSGRRDRRLFLDAVLPELAATYRAAGLRYEPIGRHLAQDLLARAEALLDGVAGASAFLTELRRVVSDDRPAAVGLCHGDLLPSNIGVAGARAYLFDWEMAGDGVIAFDLLRLALKYPRTRYLTRAIRRLIAADFSAEGARFDDQLTAYVATRIIEEPSSARVRLNYWTRHAEPRR